MSATFCAVYSAAIPARDEARGMRSAVTTISALLVQAFPLGLGGRQEIHIPNLQECPL